jgi:hypothetical protein
MTLREFSLKFTLVAAVAWLTETSRADETSEAKKHVLMIVTAAKNYRAEYGVWPSVIQRNVDTSRPAKDLTVGDPAFNAAFHNSALFNVLRAIPEGSNAEDANNPRRIVFFETRSVLDPSRPTSGLVGKDASDPKQRGCLFDPWGREYFVRFDYDESGSVEGIAGGTVKAGVAAWSVGPDGKAGTRDDITSW